MATQPAEETTGRGLADRTLTMRDVAAIRPVRRAPIVWRRPFLRVRWLPMEAEQGQVAVRAAVQALDAALAEHRRSLALAAGRRERERMAHGRAVKAVAAESERALEQPVERPMRLLRLAETWIEVDRARHRLDATVHAVVEDGELRVSGDGWSARIALAPGDGPAAAARA